MSSLFIVKLDGGSYSDYWEHWYVADAPLSHDDLGRRILHHLPHATAIKAQQEIERMDECEQLFGIREWPYNSGFIGKTGTYEQFVEWRDKWSKVNNLESIVMGLCGLHRLSTDLEVDCGDGFYDPEDFSRVAKELTAEVDSK